jgi:Flp pilus assembly protein CpaB
MRERIGRPTRRRVHGRARPMTVALASCRRFRWPTIDTRVVGGIVLVAVSVFGGLRLSRDPEPGTVVYVAASDLDAGHVLTRGDLSTSEIRGEPGLVSGLARVGHAGAPVGRSLRNAVRQGGAIQLDVLGAGVAPGREITIPVTPEHALGGNVRSGDRIDVFATFDKGTDASRTVTVARSAVVEGVVRSDGLFGQHGGALTALTLAVEPNAAIKVAFAARNADLDVVRARGELSGSGRDRYDARDLR